jgi:hypothetical protein
LVCIIAPLFAFFWPEGSPAVQSERKGFVPRDHKCLNSKGPSLSKSRGAFVEVPCFPSRYDPDPLRAPAPLFKKLDESVIEEEYARLEG